MSRTVRIIFKEEGLRGLYKGVGPSLAQVVPYMGLVFGTFNKSKMILHNLGWSQYSADFVAGCVSGLISKSVMMPLDVVRKRLQIQGSQYQAFVMRDLPVYSGIGNCIETIWRTEGILGFFRGLGLALAKSVPATMTTFVIYGTLKRIERNK